MNIKLTVQSNDSEAIDVYNHTWFLGRARVAGRTLTGETVGDVEALEAALEQDVDVSEYTIECIAAGAV
jgi:hypothetical protein